MEHRVKVTVLDKKYFRNYRRNIVQYPTVVNVLVTMWEMSSCFSATMNGMISGTWARERWCGLARRTRVACNRRGQHTAERRAFRSVPKLGMPSADISIRRCKVGVSCTVG